MREKERKKRRKKKGCKLSRRETGSGQKRRGSGRLKTTEMKEIRNDGTKDHTRQQKEKTDREGGIGSLEEQYEDKEDVLVRSKEEWTEKTEQK